GKTNIFHQRNSRLRRKERQRPTLPSQHVFMDGLNPAPNPRSSPDIVEVALHTIGAIHRKDVRLSTFMTCRASSCCHCTQAATKHMPVDMIRTTNAPSTPGAVRP
ncbi:unnamed protein product, partial [Ectocarpus sp. 6 AP-2014]